MNDLPGPEEPVAARWTVIIWPKLVRGSDTPILSGSSVALAFRPLVDEADLARSALCSLAASLLCDAASCPSATYSRHFRRAKLGWSGSIPHERDPRSRTSADSRPLALPGTECAHLRDPWRQAGRVFFQ